MEEKMNFTLMPSLKHRTLVKIAISLWSRSDIKELIVGFRRLTFLEVLKKWQEVEDKVTAKVPDLPVPKSVQKVILDFIPPIGLEVLKWRKIHIENFSIDLPAKLCWTSEGTVDRKKTAQVLVNEESISITTRYRLACSYCLEDDVEELWNSMPRMLRNEFYNEGHPSCFEQHNLEVFWSYNMKGKLSKFHYLCKKIANKEISPYQFAFEYTPIYGCKAAAEYFLQKIAHKERNESLVKFANKIAHRSFIFSISVNAGLPVISYADVLCFLLSQMDEEQQSKVVKGEPAGVLSCLLCWPWQGLFIETANHVWDFLSEKEYELLLRVIVNKIKDGYKDYNYQELYAEFWERSPNTHKKYVINENLLLLSELFEDENKEPIRLILKIATVDQKKEIIFHVKGKKICESLISKNKWDLLKFFVQECISSNDSMIKFKEEFRKHISRHSKERLERQKDLWEKFFQILDELIQKDNEKRGMEEGSSSTVKRLKSNK